MKKLRIILPLLMLVALLASCTLPKHPGNKVSFYYSRSDFAYGSEDPVVVAEMRDISGHEGELQYILSLYLMGPLDETLTGVFPGTTRQVGITQEGDFLKVHLTPIAKTLPDGQFSLACSCLSITFMELTGCTQVTVISGNRSLTLQASDLLLVDTPIPVEEEIQ